MKFLAEIDIMPHKELLDPQGKTVEKNLHHIPVTGVLDIRIGKHIQMLLEAENESEFDSQNLSALYARRRSAQRSFPRDYDSIVGKLTQSFEAKVNFRLGRIG